MKSLRGLQFRQWATATFEEEAAIDLKAVKKEIAQLEGELVTVRKKMDGYLKELGL